MRALKRHRCNVTPSPVFVSEFAGFVDTLRRISTVHYNRNFAVFERPLLGIKFDDAEVGFVSFAGIGRLNPCVDLGPGPDVNE